MASLAKSSESEVKRSLGDKFSNPSEVKEFVVNEEVEDLEVLVEELGTRLESGSGFTSGLEVAPELELDVGVVKAILPGSASSCPAWWSTRELEEVALLGAVDELLEETGSWATEREAGRAARART